MGCRRYYCAIEICSAWRFAYGSETDGGYCREQGVLEYLYYHISEHAYFHKQHASAQSGRQAACKYHGVGKAAERADVVAVEQVAERVQKRYAGYKV